MRKILLVMVLAVSGMFAANAQVDGNAIGLRLGYGAEISYQHALGDANRLELDLGTSIGSGYFGAGLTGAYHWVFDLSTLSKGFNWYVGPGAHFALWNYKAVGSIEGRTDFALGIAGQIGIEYNLENIPLQLSLDYRPVFYFLPSTGGGWDSICFGVRYKF
ncbi:MAG: hypothetical protein LBG77_08680 [Dysgonamonadaceae bacterium]|jgi:outer membrane protein W|nr:hypothetical protein [Dysgonamonadaceae bacterium]